MVKALTGFPSDVELFPIRTVSSLTGVNSITLRAWERRYGLVRPVRTPTGHRLYRRDEIDLIHRVVELLDKGISISQVQRVLRQQPAADVADDQTEDQAWSRYRRRAITAILQFDEDTLEDTYNEALGICSIDQITQRLLVPVREELIRRRETAEGSIAGERFFSMYLRNKLGTRFVHRSRGVNGALLLGACLPDEHCEIDMLLFALTAHELGLQSVLLGANVPLSGLKPVANRIRCNAIVVSGSVEPTADTCSQALTALTADLTIPVFIRGLASIHRRDQIVAAGAVPLGNDLMAGAKRISDILSESEH
jgi:DNA-binding transcriptional MerR regulator